MLRRIDFFWWGWKPGRKPGRRWHWPMYIQWGPINMCADKDWTVEGRGWLFGPLQITLWDRPNWRDFIYTPEEADEVDRLEREEMRQARTERGAPSAPLKDQI